MGWRAAYVHKRKLNGGCTGSNFNVAPGFTLVTENLMMVAVAIWMVLSAGLLNG